MALGGGGDRLGVLEGLGGLLARCDSAGAEGDAESVRDRRYADGKESLRGYFGGVLGDDAWNRVGEIRPDSSIARGWDDAACMVDERPGDEDSQILCMDLGEDFVVAQGLAMVGGAKNPGGGLFSCGSLTRLEFIPGILLALFLDHQSSGSAERDDEPPSCNSPPSNWPAEVFISLVIPS